MRGLIRNEKNGREAQARAETRVFGRLPVAAQQRVGHGAAMRRECTAAANWPPRAHVEDKGRRNRSSFRNPA